jgi:DNA-binding NarL/FixJ family response regulator
MSKKETISSVNVALVDDHILLRDALAGFISQVPGFHIGFTASNGKEMIQKFKEFGKPSILILDLNMPVMDGYDAAEWLHTHYPDVQVLILTMFDSDIPLIRLLQVGVKGFLKKDVQPDELKTALNSLIDDGYYYPIQTAGRIANMFQLNRQRRPEMDYKTLSYLELEFLKLACTELTYKEIALQLNLSPKTIDGIRDHLFERFDVKSRVGLAIYAVKNGIMNI